MENKALFDLLRSFEQEIEESRRAQIARWKKHEYFWAGIQYFIGLADTAKFYDLSSLEADNDEDAYYSKVVNIFKAHGESIIAALSVGSPGVTFFPDDADNPDDLETAKAYSNAAEIIQRRNKSKLVLVRALYILYTQGLVCAHTHTDYDDKYGVIETQIFESAEKLLCPQCQTEVEDVCPFCSTEEMQVPGVPQQVSEFRGIQKSPKGRQIIDVYGPLNVAIPHKAKDFSNVHILKLTEDWHISRARAEFPELKIDAKEDVQDYEQIARDTPRDHYDRENHCVVKRVWYRPHAFYTLKDNERDELLKQFPKGCRATFVNDQLGEATEENIEDVWVLSVDPRYKTLHADPLGEPLMPIAEVFNETFNLALQTIEQGIPQTFADSQALDFEAYKNSEARPGSIYPVTRRPGTSIEENFATLKTATLSQEIKEFIDRLEQMAQFVVGSFPSIYGGQIGGSRTAAEYQMSRQQALQRLSTAWTIVTYFWSDLIHKATKQYIEVIKEQGDERYVVKQENNFVNSWIRKSQLIGKIGECEPDVSDQFPINWAQKRDILIKLFELQIPEVNQVIFHPENADLVSRLVGLPELFIPGSDQRNKQLREIKQLMEGIQVQVDQSVDEHTIHQEVCKGFLASDLGQNLDPQITNLIRAHLQEHDMIVQQMQMGMQNAQNPAPPEGQ